MTNEKKGFSNVSVKTVLWVCLGVFLIGLANALLRISGMGTDPFGCMNLGVSGLLSMAFGTYQLIVNIVLLIPMLVWRREWLGIGTVVNMVGVGYASDFCVHIFGKIGISAASIEGIILLRLLFMVMAVLVLCLGIALYMESNLGIAPYDLLGELIPLWTKNKIKFFAARVITDIICVTIGFLSGSVVGIATVITAFFTGPLVSFFRNRLSKYIRA